MTGQAPVIPGLTAPKAPEAPKPICGDSEFAAVVYLGESTRIVFWAVGGERFASRITHPLQKAQRMGHPQWCGPLEVVSGSGLWLGPFLFWDADLETGDRQQQAMTIWGSSLRSGMTTFFLGL